VHAPLVSVALGACNGEAFIEAQLESVLAQSHRAIEVLVVDDASDDRTPDIVAAFAARDPRVRLQRNPHRLGVNANFARAFSLCSGDFIAPCDQDDVWMPEKIERLLAAIGDADLAYADSAFIDTDGHALGKRMSDTRTMIAGADHLRCAFSNTVSGHALLARSDFVHAHRDAPANVLYDWWLAFVAGLGRGLVYVDAPLVAFRRHARSQTRSGPRGTAPRARRGAGDAAERLAIAQTLLDHAAALPSPASPDLRDAAAALADALRSPKAGALCRAVLAHRRRLLPTGQDGAVAALRLAAQLAWRRHLARGSAASKP